MAADSTQRGLHSLHLSTPYGESVDLAAFAGRPAIINLWASWCAPCRRELPMMARVAAAEPGISFIFANQGEDTRRVTAYLSKQNLVLPNVVLDRENYLPQHYGTTGLPATLFVAGDGSLVEAYVGEVSPDVFAAKIAALKGLALHD